jgi:hypothetical protein
MLYKVVTFILLFSMLLSCEAPPNRNNLNPMVRYMADTMFSHRRSEIDIRMDSICLQHLDSLRALAIDSLLLIERKRINELSE